MDLRQFRQFRNEPIVAPWAEATNAAALRDGIAAARKILQQPHRLLIGEKWVHGEGSPFTNRNPNHRDEGFGPFPVASRAQAEQALSYLLYRQPAWAQRSVVERAAILRTIRAQFAAQRWILIGLLMLEVGKTGLEAYADWAEAVDFLDYYANAAELLDEPDFLAVTNHPGLKTRLRPKALGLGISLAPFNFPCAIFTGMWAAPTVMGNAMIVKPSPRAPGTGLFCARLIHEAGAPIQVILDDHTTPAAGQHVVAHPDIAIITFTGSRGVGWELNRVAAQTSQHWIKRVVAEMGGCDFIAVHDYDDLPKLLDAISTSLTGFQGQKCSALSRLIVRDTMYDEVRDAIAARLRQIQPADVVRPDTIMGGVIDERACTGIAAQCRQLEQAGARFLAGGDALPQYPGYGIPPSLHEGIDPRSDHAAIEIFGPVAGVYRARDFDELLALANATPYALTGALFTSDPALQARLGEFRPGNMYLNRRCTGAFVGAEPFGGWYGSGTDDKAGHWSHLLRFIQWQTISEKIEN